MLTKKHSDLQLNDIEYSLICRLVQEYGGSSSICYLDKGSFFFTKNGIDGFIGFKIAAGCAVVLGDPVCKEEDKTELALAFKSVMQEHKIPVIYVTATENFTRQAFGKVSLSIVELTDELYCNPQIDSKAGSKGRLFRGKVKQAKRAFVTTHEYIEHDVQLEREIQDVGKGWLERRKGPQIFLAAVDLFASREGKRWIYAKQREKIVGVALLHEMKAYKGWLLQLLLTTPDAPCGTSELLVDCCLEVLKSEGCVHLSFGTAQKKQIGDIKGMSKASVLLIRLIYSWAQKIFPLSGRKKFWMKFSPKAQPSFLMFEKNKVSIQEARAILKSVNASI